MDALSEVLKIVRLEGAIFFNAEFSAPWCVAEPPTKDVAPLLAPGASHVIIYHLLTEGRGYVQLETGERVDLAAGDIIILPHGNSHKLWNGAPVEPMKSLEHLPAVLAHGLAPMQHGGGGELTRLVCGYMTCDEQLCSVVLNGLPSIVKVNIFGDSSGKWLENSLRFMVEQAGSARAGGEAVLAKLSEALFAEALRRYVDQLPQGHAGWLGGARDAEIGKALTLLHRQPERPWTIADLAREVGISRTVLVERFSHYLGEPPITYLTRWRLNLAAQKLRSSNDSVAMISAEVGYESEPAFNRAFKRAFGTPPARYRSELRAARSGDNPSRKVTGAAD